MTDKELKKLSRLELLELLLIETKENERLKTELEKIKKENSIEKSAQLLNETANQLDAALQKVTTISDVNSDTNAAKVTEEKVSGLSKFFSKFRR
ncbi:MAG: hypothetical protein UH249_07165 [Acutalibacteraceae bacterium]|nr:hypothetical protein [Acutalibacteraceae bacterium]